MARTLPFVVNTTTCLTRDDPDIEPESPTLTELCDPLKRELAIVMSTPALQKEAGVGAAGTVGSIARATTQRDRREQST